MLNETVLLFHLSDYLQTLTGLKVLLKILSRFHKQCHHVLSDVSSSQIYTLGCILN